MKKLLCMILSATLILGICVGCGEKKPEKESSFQPSQTVQTLMDSGAFSEPLEELDPTLLFQLPGEAADYEGSVLRYSSGATAETAAVICVRQADQVGAVKAALETWVQYQIEAEQDYRPAEAEKLENAILEVRGFTVLLVVAADAAKAQAAIPVQ